MEQNTPNAGAVVSTSAEDGGDSVGQVMSNNQVEEDEEQEREDSAYGSGDFDELSKAGGTESEYDSRDYGLDEDDQSSIISPTTEDGSVTRTTETGGVRAGASGEGESGEMQGGGNKAIAGVTTAGLDDQNSLSSYADDFADDESIIPAAQHTTASPASENPNGANTATAADSGSGDAVTQQGGEDGPQRSPAAASSESKIEEKTNGGNSNRSSRGGEDGRDQRPISGSSGTHKSGDGAMTSGGGLEVREDDVERGATSKVNSSPSVSELRDRLREADLENARLREAMEKSAASASSGGSGDDRKELEILKGQVEAAKAMILSSLDDGEGKPERTLLELVLLAESRGYKQAEENAEATRAASGEGRRRKSSAATSSANAAAAAAAVKVEAIARAELEKRVESLERDLTRAGQESRAQSARAASLQRQLDGGGSGGGGGNGRSGSAQGRRGSSSGGGSALGLNGLDVTAEGVATADIMALKIKATQLVERLRQEKAMRLKAERKTQKVAGKVQVLSDHIEKLMMFLKHEATQKAKAHEQQRRLQKELELVKARSNALLRSNQAKDRVTTELREGSKILEDQLRLMDEKYMELRTKLDWTRTKADKDVRRARAQASALRTKWAILSGDGDSSLLDTMRVDPPHLSHSSSAPGIGKGGGGGMGGGAAAAHGSNNANNNTSKYVMNGAGASRGGGSPPVTKGGVAGQQRGGRGALTPNLSEAPFPGRQQQQRSGAGNGSNPATGGGSLKSAMPGYGGVASGAGVRGGSPQGGMMPGMPLNPGGLSAGTDPGGLLGDSRGGGGSGGKGRPPWSEQGGGKGLNGGRHASQQVLYA